MSGLERANHLSEINYLVVSAYNQGVSLKYIDLLQIPHREINDSQLRGKRSEVRAKVLLATIPFIERVTWPTQKEDYILKIDLWTLFVNDTGHEKIPVQIKSSSNTLTKFFKSPYAEDRRIIGLNAGPTNSNFGIIEDFKKQLIELDGFI